MLLPAPPPNRAAMQGESLVSKRRERKCFRKTTKCSQRQSTMTECSQCRAHCGTSMNSWGGKERRKNGKRMRRESKERGCRQRCSIHTFSWQKNTGPGVRRLESTYHPYASHLINLGLFLPVHKVEYFWYRSAIIWVLWHITSGIVNRCSQPEKQFIRMMRSPQKYAYFNPFLSFHSNKIIPNIFKTICAKIEIAWVPDGIVGE